MRDVKLVRLSDDGTHVVLTHEGTGEEFALRIDDRLRGFVTSDRARIAQLPVERPSRLAPKEIQARLRAGESSEDIAAAADVSLERVMRYAGPVLAEREFVAEQAQSSLLRRPPGGAQNGTQGRALGSTVTERLEALGTNTGQIRWDAWRMPDGRWAVAVFYHLPGTTEEAQATFCFDPVGRTVVPIDEAGEWILGERGSQQQQQAGTSVEGPAPRTPRDARPRLTAVPAPTGEEPEPAAAHAEDQEQDSVVRTLRPTTATASPPDDSPPAPDDDALRQRGGTTAEQGAGSTSDPSAQDRIAAEPTVDLSRSVYDQPRPSEPPAAARHDDTQQPGTPEPPRLSPADMPDLGESTWSVAAPPRPEPEPEQPTLDPTPPDRVAEPTAAPPAETTPVAPETPAAASEATNVPTEQPAAPMATPVVPEPTPTSRPEPAASTATPAAEPEPAVQHAASTQQPTIEDEQRQDGSPTPAQAAPSAGDDAVAEQEPVAANGSNDDPNPAATKKQLGQDRRTSNSRRRRASGNRRKGAVPSWDDILFGGGGNGRKE